MSESKPQKAPKDLLAGKDIPRFVVSITDTQTVMGDKYFAISAGADSLDDFNRLIPKHKRTNTARTELQNMFLHMRQATEDLERTPWSELSPEP